MRVKAGVTAVYPGICTGWIDKTMAKTVVATGNRLAMAPSPSSITHPRTAAHASCRAALSGEPAGRETGPGVCRTVQAKANRAEGRYDRSLPDGDNRPTTMQHAARRGPVRPQRPSRFRLGAPPEISPPP